MSTDNIQSCDDGLQDAQDSSADISIGTSLQTYTYSSFILCQSSGSPYPQFFLSPTGVSQGSAHGPIVFSIYVSPIAEIASSYNLEQQQYADDTQLYIVVTRLNPLDARYFFSKLL